MVNSPSAIFFTFLMKVLRIFSLNSYKVQSGKNRKWRWNFPLQERSLPWILPHLSVSIFILIDNFHFHSLHGYTTASRHQVTRNGHCHWSTTLTHTKQLVQRNVDTLKVSQGFHGNWSSAGDSHPTPVQSQGCSDLKIK